MIANKHTELRIYDNLNSLLRASLDEKEYKERITRHISQYIRNYVDENSWGKNVYDVFEDLGDSYQKHCWSIAENIKDEILSEKGETNFLDPKVYTGNFQETMIEELTNKILPHYFKELNNQISVYEYKSKIDSLRKKDRKNIVENNKDNIKFLINARISKAYEFYLQKANGNAILVLDNFSVVQEIIDDVFDDVLSSIHESIDENITKSDIEGIFSKQLKAFIKEQKALITPTEYKEVPPVVLVQEKNIKVPKSLITYGVAKIWEDITK